jgi:transcriptional regulator with XRE-family HTH domain
MGMIEFVEWLQNELDRKNMNQAELANRANISPAQISRILSHQSSPSADSIIAISKAIGVHPEFALRLAGYLPALTDSHKVAEQIASHKMGDLNEEQLEEVIQFIEFIHERDEKKLPQRRTIYRKTREGETPPEVVNEEN